MTRQVHEIIQKDLASFKVTVTPTRVTVKYPMEATPEQAARWIDFARQVAGQLGVVQNSWRGQRKCVDERPLQVLMKTKNQHQEGQLVVEKKVS